MHNIYIYNIIDNNNKILICMHLICFIVYYDNTLYYLTGTHIDCIMVIFNNVKFFKDAETPFISIKLNL